jgi:SAM-dependent methyltransferase
VIVRFPQVELLLSDVYIGRRTQVVCDAHSLPIRSGSVDGIIMQAVIDDLVDPARAISEVLRVLKPDGLVYSETPFLQPVHDGAFDFQRYTHLGHRRLFREFDQISIGPVGGVAQSFALTYHALLLSLAIGRRSRIALSVMAHLTAWWLKYADALTSQRPAALDAACGCYFLGRRGNRVLSDRELITQYQGAQARPPVTSSHTQVRDGEPAPIRASV